LEKAGLLNLIGREVMIKLMLDLVDGQGAPEPLRQQGEGEGPKSQQKKPVIQRVF
jgi:hypothetical protein